LVSISILELDPLKKMGCLIPRKVAIVGGVPVSGIVNCKLGIRVTLF
jgi:hypothetical protein